MTDSTNEYGQCCYALYENNTSSGYTSNATLYNQYTCPAAKAGTPTSWWCSDANLNSIELAIATCRQQKQICGDALVGEVAKPYEAITIGTKNIEGQGNYSLQNKFGTLVSKCGGTSNTTI